MTATPSTTGSAERWGPLWGARAEDWDEVETQQLPTYEEAIRRAAIGSGRVLDIGCGSGAFLRAAADRGVEVFGFDASDSLIAVARERVPEADLRVGDMESLPYEDDFFDVVTGFNSFFFAEGMVAALREAGRVAKPGAPVVIQVWGRPEDCDLDAMKDAVKQLMPPPPQGSAPPAPLWKPGVLEAIAEEAGLAPEETFDFSWAYEFADDDELARGLLSAALPVIAIAEVGEMPVRAAIIEAMSPYRTESGGYRLENEWHYLIARA